MALFSSSESIEPFRLPWAQYIKEHFGLSNQDMHNRRGISKKKKKKKIKGTRWYRHPQCKKL